MKGRRRTTTSLVLAYLRNLGPLSRTALIKLCGDTYNRVHAACWWLCQCGAVRQTRGGLYALRVRGDRRARAVEWVIDPITRNRRAGGAR